MTIEFDYLVAKNTSIETEAETIEDALTYVGHDFAGWYMIKTNPNSEDPLPQEHLADLSSINDDLTVYAGWTLSEYEINLITTLKIRPNSPRNKLSSIKSIFKISQCWHGMAIHSAVGLPSSDASISLL